eukprot:gnl/TRDRNA2_/TRDRNA2_136608_c0_seq1.p1 gnl/TRDRNA2_/TRDRNA2_136608_c0~~gnl/TRDRNA2_/TRDRNA2_136608_c0_seq1.p1  ORF type:complete len:925 (+),score=133.40 gnl/TRDRNA2_/TRDRNA2_136608_c0_seq1:370-2775(+)
MSRVSSYGDCRSPKEERGSPPAEPPIEDDRGVFHVIQQLAAEEGALWSILDGLKSNATHVSYFCREYWGTSASQAQLSLERLNCNERLKRQVQQACVLESLSLAVASHLCTGIMQGVSVTIRSRLRNLLYYIHENCLVLLDLVCQRWLAENPTRWSESEYGHCPENLNLDILVRVKRYRRLRKGEHIMALRQHNEMIANVVRQLCRGAATKRPPLSSRGGNSPGDRSPGVRAGGASPQTGGAIQNNVLAAVNEILTSRTPLDRLRASTIRSRMSQYMRFRPLLNTDGADPDCPWPIQDPYERYGAAELAIAQEHLDSRLPVPAVIWFEPLPPMMPDLENKLKLPPAQPDVYTLVLDLDETLVHYFELDGMGNYDIRPGMHEFLVRMNQLGYEIIIFTAATQDYADWVIDQIDPDHLVHYRLYRQHALPWGPIFVKDLSRLGRDLDRVVIIDNVQENFMLQPHNGIFICTWYEDPHDTALFALTPLLDELQATRVKVPEILEKYRDQIPTWAGFDQYSQLGCEYSDLDPQMMDDGLAQDAYVGPPAPAMQPAAAPKPAAVVPQPTPPVPAPKPPQPVVPTPQPVQTPVQPALQRPEPARAEPAQPQQPTAQQQPAPVNQQGRIEREAPPLDHQHMQQNSYTMQTPSYTPSEHSMAVGTGPASSSSYMSGYQPPTAAPATAGYLNSRSKGGYPSQQLQAAPSHEPPREVVAPKAQPSTQQPQGQLQPPGPRSAHSGTGVPVQQAPGSPGHPQPQAGQPQMRAFSGIAGPYQSGPPANQARPAFFGRPGLGPHQAPPPALAGRR